jgi:preprotein translocase subunit SecY
MNELFQIIKNSSEGSITSSPVHILFNMALALILGFLYSYVYRITAIVGKHDKQLKTEMRSMQYTIWLLTVGGALIWIVVADNLVRAFGLAGALSLIRFRTVLREPMNTIKVFYAIILGMACGLGQYYIAVLGTAVVCSALSLVYFVQKREKIEKKRRKNFWHELNESHSTNEKKF